jgi:acetyltransferase-like isoleucine patch superfamily enzyme
MSDEEQHTPTGPKSHGDGHIDTHLLRHTGEGVVIEEGVRIFHPETVSLGDRVYIGHEVMLKGYYKGYLEIGGGSWIGQRCFFHSAGGIRIGENVGIAPEVKILTSVHDFDSARKPVMQYPLKFSPVEIQAGADIGIGAIILPGVTIGEGAVIGAGSVVTSDIPAYEIWAGVPARKLRNR